MISRRIFFALLYGLVVLASLATGYALWYFLWIILTAMLLLSGLSLALVLIRFNPQQKLDPPRVEAGENTRLSIEIHNPYLFPFPQLEVKYTLPGPGKGAPYAASFTVLPLQHIRIMEDMQVPCRGVYELGLNQAMIFDIFGLFRLRLPRARLDMASDLTLTVLPKIQKLNHAMLPVLESPVNTAGAARSTEDTSAIADVRPYRPGDPLRRAHWKLSARHREIMIKNYDPAALADALIYIDGSDPGDPEDDWYADDVMASCALSLAARVLEGGVPVRIIYRDERRRQLRLDELPRVAALAEYLAKAKWHTQDDLRSLMAGENALLSASRCAYILTRRLTGPKADLLISLAKSGVRLGLVLCQAEPSDLDDDLLALRGLLVRQGIAMTVLAHSQSFAAPLAALR